eukprot:1269169-Alexandrium_andersonii.AAC.1
MFQKDISVRPGLLAGCICSTPTLAADNGAARICRGGLVVVQCFKCPAAGGAIQRCESCES